jgi:hypothetical protein
MQNSEYINACRTLFSDSVNLTPGFLKDLDHSSLKAAYRQKALETHPDRSIVLGISETEMEKRFKNVSSAYELLLPVACGEYSFLLNVNVQKKQGRKTYTKRKSPPGRKTPNDHYYTWKMPHRELLIGQYLYYSGIISWKTLSKAIVWQKKQRPLFGQIAQKWGILAMFDISRILLERKVMEKFGDCAIRKGYITSFQQMAIVGRQRRLQRPIGEYFIENEFLVKGQIDEIARQNILRNVKLRLFSHNKPRFSM